MVHWLPYVFVRITLFFIAGILLGIYQPDVVSYQTAQYILFACVLVYFSVVYSKHWFPVNPGFIGLACIFVGGYTLVLVRTDGMHKDHINHIQEPISYYRAVVLSEAEEKERSWKVVVEVNAIKTETGWQSANGKVLVYISKQYEIPPVHYGDVLLVKGSPQLLRPPANPGEFDYKRFLSFRKTYHQHFLAEGSFNHVGNEPPSLVMQYATIARRWAYAAIHRNISGEQERAIAAALVLGIKDGLDNELIGAYAATGSMHVLAVSGLHVGIIYWMVLWLCKPLNRSVYGKWIAACLGIFVLWSYAFITGLSPSVLRAVTMFSFVALAHASNRGTSIYNTLAATAFCLLLFEPYLIMSVGFQLSFMAVLGIVYLHPILYNLVTIKNKLGNAVWKITCVSIAAQVATFSLGLLYFHQFPNYFFLSNLFVIPAAFGVLVVGLMMILFSWISALGTFLGMVVENIISLLNSLVFFVEQLPLSITDHVYITTFQCWLIMGILVSMIILKESKKILGLYSAFLLSLVFCFSHWNHIESETRQSTITIYKVDGHSAIDFQEGNQVWFMTDTMLVTQHDKIRFHIRPNRLQAGITKVHSAPYPFAHEQDGFRLIVWRGKTIIQVYQSPKAWPENLQTDLLIISNNAVRSLLDIPAVISADQLILDSSNAMSNVQRIKSQASTLGLDIFSVPHQGAFQLTL